MQRKCSECGIVKDLAADFYRQRDYKCVECVKESRRQFRVTHKIEIAAQRQEARLKDPEKNKAMCKKWRADNLDVARDNARQNYVERRKLIIEYKKLHPCIDCGNNDPRVLEFDHRDCAAKRFNVSSNAHAYAWETVLAEIAKCDMRCANCHKIKTAINREYVTPR